MAIAAAEHEVAERQLLVHVRLDARVEALVAPANKGERRLLREAARVCLPEWPPRGREEDTPWPHAERGVDRLERRDHYVDTEDHAAATTVGRIVDAPVAPHAVLTRALEGERDEALLRRLAHDRRPEKALKELRKQGHERDALRRAHGVTSSRAPAHKTTRAPAGSTAST